MTRPRTAQQRGSRRTGLGLPVVRQIVEQHGGTVTLASEPGKGARIAIRLPLRAAMERAA